MPSRARLGKRLIARVSRSPSRPGLSSHHIWYIDRDRTLPALHVPPSAANRSRQGLHREHRPSTHRRPLPIATDSISRRNSLLTRRHPLPIANDFTCANESRAGRRSRACAKEKKSLSGPLWSKLGGSNHNHLLLTGAVAICWAIWITRNDVVFDKGHPKTFLQVFFRGTHWLRFWALLQRSDDDKEQIRDACKLLE